MRKPIIMAVAFAAFLGLAGIAFSEEPAWFDMDNCSFCQELTREPGLLDNMTWEHHNISNGVITVTTVDPEFEEAYIKSQKAMEEVAAKLASGEGGVTMCGHCKYYGELMMAGAKIEHVAASKADILLITSDDPETIKKIHKYGDRNREEMAKMEKAK
jgi:hypothetical protein